MEEENSNDATVTSSDVIDVLAETLLVRFLSKDVAAKFYEAVENFNTSFNNTKKNIGNDGDDNREIKIVVNNNDQDGTLSIGKVNVSKRVPTLPELVPDPVFFENNSQLQVLENMLRSYSAEEENGVLLIGNQGVGKNKLIDRLLNLLNAEREYVQVHRDTCLLYTSPSPRD